MSFYALRELKVSIEQSSVILMDLLLWLSFFFFFLDLSFLQLSIHFLYSVFLFFSLNLFVIYFMYVGVWVLCVRRSEESVGSSGTGVTGHCRWL